MSKKPKLTIYDKQENVNLPHIQTDNVDRIKRGVETLNDGKGETRYFPRIINKHEAQNDS